MHERGSQQPGVNHQGPIASTYEELQGLHFLHCFRSEYASGTNESCMRSIFQVAEVLLWNNSDLLVRAAQDVRAGRMGHATQKVQWLASFHNLLVQVGRLPKRLAFESRNEALHVVRVHDSDAIKAFQLAQTEFDQTVDGQLKDWSDCFDYRDDEFRSLDRMLHYCAIAFHDTTIWESDLASLAVPFQVKEYSKWIGAERIRKMVHDMPLQSDTYLMQFRCLHQIPEILGAVANSHLLIATKAAEFGDPWECEEHVSIAIALVEVVVSALRPMVECMSVTYYHDIRENLGVTSGSQSEGLHDQLLGRRYEMLCEAVVDKCLTIALDKDGIDAPSTISSLEALRIISDHRTQCDLCRGFDRVVTQLIRLHQLLQHWRAAHMHLPRNNLGGGRTRSLIGATNAVYTVQRMREKAERADPADVIVQSRFLESREATLPLTQYLHSSNSLDSRILAFKGGLTRQAFPDVQDRAGVFAGKCPQASSRTKPTT